MDTRNDQHSGETAAGKQVMDKFDDDDYPAYTMGRAAEMLGTTPGFLTQPPRLLPRL